MLLMAQMVLLLEHLLVEVQDTVQLRPQALLVRQILEAAVAVGQVLLEVRE